MTPQPDLQSLSAAANSAVTKFQASASAVADDQAKLKSDQDQNASDGASAAAAVQAAIAGYTAVLASLPAPPAPASTGSTGSTGSAPTTQGS